MVELENTIHKLMRTVKKLQKQKKIEKTMPHRHAWV